MNGRLTRSQAAIAFAIGVLVVQVVELHRARRAYLAARREWAADMRELEDQLAELARRPAGDD